MGMNGRALRGRRVSPGKRMGVRSRREFLRLSLHASGATAAAALLPASIRKALAIPAARVTGTLQDVEHVVILMQENRSFDHYFGTLRGVRGFGDRHPVPLASGKPVWHQSDGQQRVQPYHLDTRRTSAWRVPEYAALFLTRRPPGIRASSDSGRSSRRRYSMGYYRRDDLPFQFALAEAFTLCDAYHCSVTTGTDPNRIVFWSGSNFDPAAPRRGENCTDDDSEPDNLRCWVTGDAARARLPLCRLCLQLADHSGCARGAGISWRIYQDPNDNWTGAMHGGLAFESFRQAAPGSPVYEKGMSHWSLEQLKQDVAADELPRVSWILPAPLWSEHPCALEPPAGRGIHGACARCPDRQSKSLEQHGVLC